MKEMSPVVKTITKIAFGFILVFGLYIIVHGHMTPGGGFQGGAIIGTLMALYLVAFGATKWKKKIYSTIESSGLLIFIITGLIGLVAGSFFFNFIAGTDSPIFGRELNTGEMIKGVWFPSNTAPLFSAGTISIMNMAVGLEVIAGLTLIVVTMGLFAFAGKEGDD
jgi:multicomponent Na+:H+ antiporter subunit B